MGELGIALVGLIGAIVGAVVGFIALAWQHSAVRDEDVRKAGAQLLYHAEVVKNSYVQYRETPVGGRHMTDFLQKISVSADKVGELMRYIEIAASVDLYAKVKKFVAETEKFQDDLKYVQISKSQIPDERLYDDLDQWFIVRNSLAIDLKFPGAKPLQWRLQQLKKVLLDSHSPTV